MGELALKRVVIGSGRLAAPLLEPIARELSELTGADVRAFNTVGDILAAMD